MDNIRALVIIPAKMDSTRVKNKNLRIIAGQTLLEHSLDYAMKSKYTIFSVGGVGLSRTGP